MIHNSLYVSFYAFIRVSLALLLLSAGHTALAGDWRWQLSAGQLHQDYQELDSSDLTPTSYLNVESGALTAVKIIAVKDFGKTYLSSYQDVWTPQLSADLLYAQGSTDYEGYLQAGSQFIPYLSQSDNRIWQGDIRFGMRSGKMYNDAPTLTYTPHLTASYYRWQRDLDDYSERFAHSAVLAGVSLHLRPDLPPSLVLGSAEPKPKPLVITATGEYGRIFDSEIDVPKLGLKQEIGQSNIWRFGLAADYQLNNKLSLNASVTQQGWDYESSDVQNGYQYPASESVQTLWQLGLGYQF